jgi:hypothetical protein
MIDVFIAYMIKVIYMKSDHFRSNIAVMFLSDLVLDGLEIDWSAHLPLMLHVIFLGRSEVVFKKQLHM